MKREIPVPVIAVVADVLGKRYTHSRIDYFMEIGGVQGQPPGGNRVDKSRAWLKQANELNPDPLGTLGRVITELMEVDSSGYASDVSLEKEREKVSNALGRYGLEYVKGGHITGRGASAAARNLQAVIEQKDLAGLHTEFDRIYDNLNSDPAAAVTAACALLESLFKYYIEEKGLTTPAEQSIKPLWKVVRKDLNLDPDLVSDHDLKTILGGLAAIVEGIGALRTHKGSAHGQGKTVYRLLPRHARLAAHAAFSVASFVLETWK